MSTRTIVFLILMLSTLFLRHSSVGQIRAEPCPGCGRGRPLVAAGQILGLNTLVWGYDRFVANEDWARVTPESWKQNLTSAPEFDHNSLIDNQIAHPYHGGIFFSIARSNGFNYWKSFGFTVLGSSTWEWFGEVYRPSPNDLITTTIGGAALGETFFRLSGALRSSQRVPSWLRKAGAALLSPAQALNGGQPAPAGVETVPSAVRVRLGGGAEHVGYPMAGIRSVFSVAVEYGSLAIDEVARPFDVMSFRLRGGVGPNASLDVVESQGALTAAIMKLGRTAVGIFQDFDFLRTPTFEFGGQSLSAGITHRQRLIGDLSLTTTTHAGVVLFGCTPARVVNGTEGRKDYGPGGIAKFSGSLLLGGFELLRVRASAILLRSVVETNGRHVAIDASAQMNIPIVSGYSIGVAAQFTHRSSHDNVERDPASFSSRARAFVQISL